jgi:hypothetical protein
VPWRARGPLYSCGKAVRPAGGMRTQSSCACSGGSAGRSKWRRRPGAAAALWEVTRRAAVLRWRASRRWHSQACCEVAGVLRWRCGGVRSGSGVNGRSSTRRERQRGCGRDSSGSGVARGGTRAVQRQRRAAACCGWRLAAALCSEATTGES